jgi:hypothetical protein
MFIFLEQPVKQQAMEVLGREIDADPGVKAGGTSFGSDDDRVGQMRLSSLPACCQQEKA